MVTYDFAQICPNGHVANAHAATCPENNQEFCDRCGEKTITECLACKQPIRGRPLNDPGGYRYQPPAFCHNCGNAFSWTERKQRAAIDLFREENQSSEDQREFQQSVEQIAKDSPEAQAASKKIVRLLKHAGKQTAKAIRDILVDIAGEAAKRTLLGR